MQAENVKQRSSVITACRAGEPPPRPPRTALLRPPPATHLSPLTARPGVCAVGDAARGAHAAPEEKTQSGGERYEKRLRASWRAFSREAHVVAELIEQQRAVPSSSATTSGRRGWRSRRRRRRPCGRSGALDCSAWTSGAARRFSFARAPPRRSLMGIVSSPRRSRTRRSSATIEEGARAHAAPGAGGHHRLREASNHPGAPPSVRAPDRRSPPSPPPALRARLRMLDRQENVERLERVEARRRGVVRARASSRRRRSLSASAATSGELDQLARKGSIARRRGRAATDERGMARHLRVGAADRRAVDAWGIAPPVEHATVERARRALRGDRAIVAAAERREAAADLRLRRAPPARVSRRRPPGRPAAARAGRCPSRFDRGMEGVGELRFRTRWSSAAR